MNRYSVTTPNGTMRLYYSSINIAKKAWPDATIEPYNDMSHLEYIIKILEQSRLIGYDHKNCPTYQFDSPIGNLKMKFSIMDGEYLDFCMYQLMPVGRVIEPITWTLSTPKAVWGKFFVVPKYEELSWCCKSSDEKIGKPKELKGIKQIGSVPFAKSKCAVYVAGNNVYVNHHDYFSPSLKVNNEDVGMPLGCLVKKYCGKSRASKFIYDDAWGDIVLQNVAWLKFENVVELIKDGWGYNTAIWMRDEVFKNLGFKNDEGGYMEWERFFEEVCKVVEEN